MVKFFKQMFCKHRRTQSRSQPHRMTCIKCRHRR